MEYSARRNKAVTLNQQEFSLILAAIRYWQRMSPSAVEPESAIASDGGIHEILEGDAIDQLIERMQFDHATSAASMLVAAYADAEADGGSVDWSDIDAAHAQALVEMGTELETCDECGHQVDAASESLLNRDHADSCSLHPTACEH